MTEAEFFFALSKRLKDTPPKDFGAHGMQLKEAAVLAPLFWRNGEPWALLTRRPTTMRKHPGQIAFPGGSRDFSDLTPLHTALRETHEEIGLSPGQIQTLGRLGAMPTITRFFVTPFVGWVQGPFALKPNPHEIEKVLEAPLWRLRQEKRHFYGADRDAWVWEVGDEAVWGATHRMLDELMGHVAALGRG